ncbi:MAG: DUF1365 domain-containing protein [Verrucomicrobiota bacterium]|nr:DUF1365 domain-containing protein [Verrucomicrobiota bacterium]
MNSSLYFGRVRHHRKSPKIHNLEYGIFMAHLFLDELKEVFKGRWLWSINKPNLSSFKRTDYHRPEIESLQDAVRDTMTRQLGEKMSGKVSILTHLRTFGYCFNPVTFYYLWGDDLTSPVAIMTEITNTPWGERYAKCFRWKDTDMNEKSEYDFRKEFHVSPFIGMDVDYDWRFQNPQETVKIDMYLRQNNKSFFSAHLHLKQKAISFKNLSMALIRFPFMTLKVTAAIYWNALLLKLKGCPFYSHPKHLETKHE